MTREQAEWLLRLPADEIVLGNDELNRLSAALQEGGWVGEGIKYRPGFDNDGRATRTPDTLADRKITLMDVDGAYVLREKGQTKAAVRFP